MLKCLLIVFAFRFFVNHCMFLDKIPFAERYVFKLNFISGPMSFFLRILYIFHGPSATCSRKHEKARRNTSKPRAKMFLQGNF